MPGLPWMTNNAGLPITMRPGRNSLDCKSRSLRLLRPNRLDKELIEIAGEPSSASISVAAPEGRLLKGLGKVFSKFGGPKGSSSAWTGAAKLMIAEIARQTVRMDQCFIMT